MADDSDEYEIDDKKSVDGNLAALGDALKEIDSDLADILSPKLQNMSADASIAKDQLFDALYAATDEDSEAKT